jgi:hypothetical protein
VTAGNGKVWAYLGAIVGGAVSVTANVAHSYVPPAGAAAGWAPHQGAVMLAAFWPLALLVAVEILARVVWPAKQRWMLIRWCGLTPVAVVAAIVSYRHLSGLLDFYGEDDVTVGLGPLAVDGLMVISTGALLALRAVTADPVVVAEADPAPGRSWIRFPIRFGARLGSWSWRRARALDPIRDPILDPRPDPIAGSTGSGEPLGSDRVEESMADPIVEAVESHESGRLLVLADRVAREVESASADVDPVRQDDLTRVRAFIKDGTLPSTPSADKIRVALKPCGPTRARAVRDAIKNETEQRAEAWPTLHRDQQAPETRGSTTRTTATRTTGNHERRHDQNQPNTTALKTARDLTETP